MIFFPSQLLPDVRPSHPERVLLSSCHYCHSLARLDDSFGSVPALLMTESVSVTLQKSFTRPQSQHFEVTCHDLQEIVVLPRHSSQASSPSSWIDCCRLVCSPSTDTYIFAPARNDARSSGGGASAIASAVREVIGGGAVDSANFILRS